MIDFVSTTGKKIGKVLNTKLGEYFGKGEGAMRAIKKKDPKQFDIIYLGSFCHANGIDIKQLRLQVMLSEEIIKINEKESFYDALEFKPASYGVIQAEYENYLIALNQYDKVYDIREKSDLGKNIKSRITKEELITYFNQ